ncbi:MAG: KTSC domain-containing protein, partial [Betaproteobacteria bacterium]
MERKRVNSSKIRAAGYDAKSQVLEIEFSDGKLIQYRGVSPEVHRQ